MQILTNTLSLNVQQSMRKNELSLQRSMQRVVSGVRITAAQDDPARAAISERMGAQIRGGDQARRNLNNAVSVMQVTDGGLNQVSGMLQRMRELAVQAANGTLSMGDRQALQKEADQLLAGIDQISSDTEFNGEKVFEQGRSGIGGDPNRLAVLDGLRLGWLEEAENRISQYYGIKADGALTMKVNLDTSDGAGNALASVSTTAVGADGRWQDITLNVDMADFTPPNLPDGGSAPVYNDRIIAHEMVHAEMSRSMNFNALPNWFKEGMAEFIHGADERVKTDYNSGAGWATMIAAFNVDSVAASAGYSAGYSAVRYMHQKIKDAGGSGIKEIMTYLSQNPAATLDQALTNASRGAFANLAGFQTSFQTNGNAFVATFNFANEDTGAIGGLDVDGGSSLSAKDVLLGNGTRNGENALDGFKLDIPDYIKSSGQRFLDLQIGANDEDRLRVGLAGVNTGALAISTVDLVKGAKFALARIDEALDAVSNARGQIGAAMARLDFSSQALETRRDNLSLAKQRMSDTDYAQEMSALTRDQILRQSSGNMLKVANAAQERVLDLLRFAGR
ncbi:flagellinolysin [Dechloromonas sp. ZY10]|uniref:flagellinolysin n=1 Tax=Dechloromonas aquae TaxID=2664436 RepID=UPI003528D555